MSRSALTTYLVLRELDEPIDRAAVDSVRDRIEDGVREVLRSGVELEWDRTDVLANHDGEIVALLDEFRLDGADAERVFDDHADAAEVPMTSVWALDDRIDGEHVERRKSRR
ncbi:hypothetical protein [Halococcus saccharolyticus]|uniref:Uncharacterized protein n=1 Tax=Halococcus saccharolyticus DSM 5350 TaxID=1227455 RepID=M0MCW4_9EURY|nr:hypothetical protein [Halococcus saccharolyticus]EMA43193.1 hypothetical protein C449_14482 [Halococcus saccharolyticus DSM 5350]